MYGLRTQIENAWAIPEMHGGQAPKCGRDQSAGWEKKRTAGDGKLTEELGSRDIRTEGDQPVDDSTRKREEMFVNNLTAGALERGSDSVGNRLFSSQIWGEVTYKLFAPGAEIIKKGQQVQQMGESYRGESLRETDKGVTSEEGGNEERGLYLDSYERWSQGDGPESEEKLTPGNWAADSEGVLASLRGAGHRPMSREGLWPRENFKWVLQTGVGDETPLESEKLTQGFHRGGEELNQEQDSSERLKAGRVRTGAYIATQRGIGGEAGSSYIIRQQSTDTVGRRFSRKVFIGGIPSDVDVEQVQEVFGQFGQLEVSWPRSANPKLTFFPKGFAFLVFREEKSVHRLLSSCGKEEGKWFLWMGGAELQRKKVQIRPWDLADNKYVKEGTLQLDSRKTAYIGAIPRQIKASELAVIVNNFYGGVCQVTIHVDLEFRYPRGSGRVVFANRESYMAAVKDRYVKLRFGKSDKRVEITPFILDNQHCDVCYGNMTEGNVAPFFCAELACLRYYCEPCWVVIHAENEYVTHRPFRKGWRKTETRVGDC